MFYELVNGNFSRENLNVDEREAVQHYNDYIFAKTFGWTPQQIAELPKSYYEDFISIITLEAAKNNKKPNDK